MGPKQIFDFGIPYNIFTGVWTATQSSYSPKGVLIASTAVEVAIYWSESNRMHFRQDPLPLKTTQGMGLTKAAAKLSRWEFDLDIVGKCATGQGPGGVKNIGVETTPDCYIFKITKGAYVWFNNQYCPTANERVVIGPQLFNNNVQSMLSQHLTRISYEVPMQHRLRRALK
jgi:hypothetical protein